MDVERFVRTYYEALRNGEPLAPFFADGPDVVKVGISERLVGGDSVADGLTSQTERTTAWSVESRDLHATTVDDQPTTVDDAGTPTDGYGWFADDVCLAWTDTERSVRYEFDSRWSGTVVRMADPDAADERFDGWRFVGMHVSVPRSL